MNTTLSELIDVIEKLHKMTGQYTTFAIRYGSGTRSMYCVYTGIIGHKQFDSAGECLAFVISIIEGDETDYQRKYLTEKREELIESIASLEEQVTDVEYELKELEGK